MPQLWGDSTNKMAQSGTHFRFSFEISDDEYECSERYGPCVKTLNDNPSYTITIPPRLAKKKFRTYTRVCARASAFFDLYLSRIVGRDIKLTFKGYMHMETNRIL